MSTNIIIAGGRQFADYDYLLRVVNDIIIKHNINDIVIVSGMASGADAIGVRYAIEHNYKYLECPADWRAHGIRAGYIRNTEMAKISQILIAFWDGFSVGTKHMIHTARRHKLQVHIAKYTRT